MVRLVERNRRPARNYLSRWEQWRLLMLILPLGLVMVLMAQLRDPQTAKHVNKFFAPGERQSIKPRPVVAGSPADEPQTTPQLFPGVRPDLLKTIRDNTYFRNAEKQAWFHLFEMLQRTPPDELEAAPSVEAGYVQLVDQPHVYRGKLVSIYGQARQITRQTPAPNDLGIESYYRVVIQPADGSDWPVFVYCLELPAGLSQGDDLARHVKATGLFFKKLSYQWQNGLGIAPVIVARSIEELSDASGEASHIARRPPADDVWKNDDQRTVNETNKAVDNSANRATAFQDILKLAGWDQERLAQFDDGQPLSNEHRSKALEVLRRLRSLDAVSIDDWSQDELATSRVITEPNDFRGQLVKLAGRVVHIARHEPKSEDAERLEMPAYFECELALEKDAGTAIVLTTRVPRAWLPDDDLDEPATASALYLKRLPGDDPRAVWLAKELAWHPTTAKEPDVSFGESILGTLGMDVGLLDDIQSRGRIRAEEREAFYQILGAVKETGPHQLIRFAQTNLPAIGEQWKRELESAADESRRKLAGEVVRRAAEGRYSVAPLFNDPESQIGRLVVVDGRARRVVRIEVGSRPDGGPSDVARRFGLDHYFELEVFTDDSQTYPLVFCVRELPADFPTAGEMSVPVRVAGFFFKDWLYRTRHSGAKETDGQAVAVGRSQYAPLLIGRAPVLLATQQGGGEVASFVAGGLFLLALVGVWAAAAWYARGDRRLRERTLAKRFSLPAGESLDELNLLTGEEPMTIKVQSDSPRRDSSQ